MEHNFVMKKQRYYNWHAGAPSYTNFEAAQEELIFNLKKTCKELKISVPSSIEINKSIKKEKSIEIH